METISLRNQDIRRAILGVPKGHRHLRLILETDSLRLILQEATLANLVRAYMGTKTHPQRRAVELTLSEVSEEKEGFSRFQLLEAEKGDDEIEAELGELIPLLQ